MDTGIDRTQVNDLVYIALAERGWTPSGAEDDDLLDDLVDEVLGEMDARLTDFLVERDVIDPQ